MDSAAGSADCERELLWRRRRFFTTTVSDGGSPTWSGRAGGAGEWACSGEEDGEVRRRGARLRLAKVRLPYDPLKTTGYD